MVPSKSLVVKAVGSSTDLASTSVIAHASSNDESGTTTETCGHNPGATEEATAAAAASGAGASAIESNLSMFEFHTSYTAGYQTSGMHGMTGLF